MEIKVAKIVDESTLVVSKGLQDGLKPGQRLLVYCIGPEIKDPDSGESLGNLEVVRGTGRITHIQEKMATVTSDTKTVRRIVRTGPSPHIDGLLKLFGPIYSREVEETLPGEVTAFRDPQIGDLARIIE